MRNLKGHQGKNKLHVQRPLSLWGLWPLYSWWIAHDLIDHHLWCETMEMSTHFWLSANDGLSRVYDSSKMAAVSKPEQFWNGFFCLSCLYKVHKFEEEHTVQFVNYTFKLCTILISSSNGEVLFTKIKLKTKAVHFACDCKVNLLLYLYIWPLM